MSRQLLVQSCSATKAETENPLPALERYDGYFFKIIKKAISDGVIDPELDICILSAEYGLLDPDDEIPYYNRRMDTERAQELRSTVVQDIREKVSSQNYDRIVLNMGREYRSAVSGLEENLDTEVLYIEGGGIGEKGHILKGFIRGEDALISAA